MCGILSAPALVLLLSTHVAVSSGNPRILAVLPETAKQVRALVRQLDDDDVDVRDKASEELAKLGRLALPILLETMQKSPPSEVEFRVVKLLAKARTEDFNARYPVFLADKKLKYEHDFSGWNELKKAAKDTPASRKLFAAILADDECRAMLVGAFATSPEERKAFEKRRQTTFLNWLKAGGRINTDPEWSVEWNVASLLADLIYAKDYSDDIRLMSLRGCWRAKWNADVREGKGAFGSSTRSIFEYWGREQQGTYGLHDAETLCDVMGTDVAIRIRYLRQLVSSEDKKFRGYAMDKLAEIQGKSAIRTLLTLFDDDSQCYRGLITDNDGTPWKDEWRDLALALCVVLSSQNPEDYGFKTINTNASLRLKGGNYRFLADDKKTAEEKPTAAFKKWAEWEKANPKAIPPEDKK